jgi:DNA-binding FrmR family transcriptional regulator
LLNRWRRIGGRIDAVERRLDGGSPCSTVLQQARACRGASDGFIAEAIEDHIREHTMDPEAPRDNPRAQATEGAGRYRPFPA